MKRKFLTVLLCLSAMTSPATAQPVVDLTPVSSGPAGTPRFGQFLRQVDGLSAPCAVAISANREVYVVERDANRVTVLDRDGNWLRVLGSPTPAASQPADPRSYGSEDGQFDRPSGIAIAPDGSIFITDTYNHRVQVFNPSGEWQRAFGQRGESPADLFHPTGIAVTNERVYIADSGNGRVQVFDINGGPQQMLGSFGAKRPGDFLRPAGLVTDATGRLYASDADAHRIQRFDATGTPLAPISDRGYFPGLLAEPLGLTIYKDQLFIADSMNHRVQVFDLDGKVQYQWGLHVVKPRDGFGKLHYPTSVAIDPQGEFAVVAEAAEDRIQIFGLKGPEDPIMADWNMPDPEPGSHYGERICIGGDLLFLTEPETAEVHVYDQTHRKPLQISNFGGYGVAPGKFIQPAGMSFDAAQRKLYVCDPGNQRIQVFKVGATPRPLKFDPRLVALETVFDLSAIAPAESGAHVEPVSIVSLGPDQVLTLDRRNGRLLQLSGNGTFLSTIGPIEPPLADSTDLAVHQDWWTWVYIADPGARCVRVGVLDREKRWRSMPGVPIAQAEFIDPFGVAVAPGGLAYATDSYANRVQSFLPKGASQAEQWGGTGLGAGQFLHPRGVAVDTAGLVTIVDYGNHRAQTFTPEGQFVRVFGARWYSLPAEAGVSSQPAWPPTSAREQQSSQPARRSNSAAIRKSGNRTLAPPQSTPETTAPTIARGDEIQARSPLGNFEVIAHLSQFPPPLNKPFEVTLIVRDAKAALPVSLETMVTVDADMPEHRHGLLSSPRLEQSGPGRFRIHDLNFHMPGYWELYVDLNRNGVLERVVLAMNVD